MVWMMNGWVCLKDFQYIILYLYIMNVMGKKTQWTIIHKYINWYSVPKTESQWFRIRILFKFLSLFDLLTKMFLKINACSWTTQRRCSIRYMPWSKSHRNWKVDPGFWNLNDCFCYYCRFWVIWGNLIKLLLSLVMLYEIIEDSFICDAMLMMYFLCKQTGVFTLTEEEEQVHLVFSTILIFFQFTFHTFQFGVEYSYGEECQFFLKW